MSNREVGGGLTGIGEGGAVGRAPGGKQGRPVYGRGGGAQTIEYGPLWIRARGAGRRRCWEKAAAGTPPAEEPGVAVDLREPPKGLSAWEGAVYLFEDAGGAFEPG